ncbi:MAG: hypothetical protein K8F91_00830 [Candidatus Obscuribacterales bacterium]|nr:hypothetical protein [Candidatus Obscuribacterales bacterium]
MKVHVHVTENGEIRFNGNPVRSAETIDLAKAFMKEQEKYKDRCFRLLLTSDEEALHKHVARVLDAASGCRIDLVTIKAPTPAPERAD